MRKIAVSKVYIIKDENITAPQSSSEIVEQYINHVVEIDEDKTVVNHFPLTEEIPMTEWLGGTVVIRNGKATYHPSVLPPKDIV